MDINNETNPKNRGNRKTSEEKPQDDRINQLEPKPEKDLEDNNESAFMKTFKNVGYSVWLTVMIIGAGLAFIVGIFLL